MTVTVTTTYRTLEDLQLAEYALGQAWSIYFTTDESALTLTVSSDDQRPDTDDPEHFEEFVESCLEEPDPEWVEESGFVSAVVDQDGAVTRFTA